MFFREAPRGYAQVVGVAAAANLPSPPADADLAVITVTGQNIMWRDDGSDPTTTVGNLIKTTDSPFEYRGNLNGFRMIQVSATATVNVTYYKTVG